LSVIVLLREVLDAISAWGSGKIRVHSSLEFLRLSFLGR
jgi:hypothetical protein